MDHDKPHPAPGELKRGDQKLIGRLIEVVELDIIPLTEEGVGNGNKVFGAALLRKSDLSTIIAGTNHESENPLWHGEVYTIKKYYEMVNADESKRVDPKDIIFLCTHEPCTLCLSAITWSGFDNFIYLFGHEETRDTFNIGHDLGILKQIFKHEPGGYAKDNDYWSAYRLADLIGNCDAATRAGFDQRLDAIRTAYFEMSKVYQAHKGEARNIPLK